MESQTVARGGTTLMNLGYNYADGNGKRTGQLVSISNNLDHNKDRGYEYDALGRLKRATSGQNVNWAQRYAYDRYGNRNNVYSMDRRAVRSKLLTRWHWCASQTRLN
jgi:YD repeat-containing protein